MNEVKKLLKHTIYYFCDNKIKYYINVPHKEFNVTNISLEFLEDTAKYDPEINDVEFVRQNIIEYYEQVDNDNITLVMPILKEDEKNMFLSLNVNKLNVIEKTMALYINSSYMSLINNNVKVNKEVYLIENNKYINFIKYFKDKHNSRIIVKRLVEISSNNIESIPVIDNIVNTDINSEVIDGLENNVDVPFSINENVLNDIINLDIESEKKQIIEPKIETNIPISINSDKDNNVTEDKELKEEPSNFIVKDNKEHEETNDETIETIEKNNINKENRVINISDLGNLTNAGLNGALPGNVTINIEKLVTENKNQKNEEVEEDNEVSELDEDISDIDDFDENEDFDIDAIDVSEAVLSSDDGNKNYRTITSGGIKFVVGKKDDENLKAIEINKNTNKLDLNEQNLEIEMPTNIIKGEDQINKNAGFASYFTLFFVTISAVFLIIYIIIK